MKTVAAIVIALLVLVPSSSALEPGPWKINLTGNVLVHDGDTKVYSLFNKPAYKYRLGTGFLTCHSVGEEFDDCAFTLRLSRGEVIARGVVPMASQFRVLAVVGGTGLYSNVGGQALVQPLGDGVVLILVDLAAF